MIDQTVPLQEQLPAGSLTRQCFGCGADNDQGLGVRSYWRDGEGVCLWRGESRHRGGGAAALSGGVTATIMDCHSMWTAMATICTAEGIGLSSERRPTVLTRSMKVDYLRPTPLGTDLTLRARVVRVGRRSLTVTCSLYDGDVECARSEIVGVRVEAGAL